MKKTKSEKTMDALPQEKRPTWRDFYAAKERSERAIILQKMYEGHLTPEELAEILDA